jgi:uncharacterized protein (TIGR02266 family)
LATTTNTRQASRSPVTLKIKFKSATLDQFIERYSVDVSHGGIFIRTKDPLPVGTTLRFEFQLKDATPLIAGDGTVVWTREFDPNRSGVAPGMGVRFDRLPGESQAILDRILSHKQKLGATETPLLADDGAGVFTDVPTRVAPADLVDSAQAFTEQPTRVTPAHILKGLQDGGPEPRRTLMGLAPLRPDRTADDKTPLPRPLPFHSDLDDFPDDAFEQATKVAALDSLARRSAGTDDAGHDDDHGDDDVTEQRTRRPSAPVEDGRGEDRDQAAARGADGKASAPLFAIGSAGGPGQDQRADTDLDSAQANRSGDGALGLEERADDDQAGDRAGDQAGDSDTARDRGAGAEADDEDSEDEQDSGASEAYAPPPPVAAAATGGARATVARPASAPEPERDGGSSLPWIAAAALILVVGAVAGVWYLRDRGDAAALDRAGSAPAETELASAAADAPPDPIAAASTPAVVPDTPPAAAGIAAVVQSTPAGATAELIGGGQSGITPMTFTGLEAGTTYKVRVSHAGFVSAEIEFEAGGESPAPIVLSPKPIVLRVASTPPGAQIFVDGRRQGSVTPAALKLAARTAAQKQIVLSVRKAGFDAAEQTVALEGLVEEDDSMVQEVTLALEKRQVAARPQPAPAGDRVASPPDTAPDPGRAAADKPAADKPAADKPAADKPATDKPAADKPAADKPAADRTGAGEKSEPTPDWMKK